MSRISSGIATSGSSLTSCRISSIGKSGARSSGPTGSPVPGGGTGSGAGGMSARMLYQRRGSRDSSSRNLVCSKVSAEERAQVVVEEDPARVELVPDPEEVV